MSSPKENWDDSSDEEEYHEVQFTSEKPEVKTAEDYEREREYDPNKHLPSQDEDEEDPSYNSPDEEEPEPSMRQEEPQEEEEYSDYDDYDDELDNYDKKLGRYVSCR
jgi:hypothetical protein